MMRLLGCVLFAVGCVTTPGPTTRVEPAPAAPLAAPVASPTAVAPAPAVETLSADTPKTTAEGNPFIAPAGWGISASGPVTRLTAPEGDSHVVLVDLRAKDADAAVAAAWAHYKPDFQWPLKVVTPSPDRDGWTERARQAGEAGR